MKISKMGDYDETGNWVEGIENKVSSTISRISVIVCEFTN